MKSTLVSERNVSRGAQIESRIVEDNRLVGADMVVTLHGCLHMIVPTDRLQTGLAPILRLGLGSMADMKEGGASTRFNGVILA